MSTVLLLLNGELHSLLFIQRILRKADMVLCVDGGVRHAARLNIEPAIIIGDMDSLPIRLPRWKRAVYLCDFDQNVSDFEKALRFLVRGGTRKMKTGTMDSVFVAGATGGRTDHTMVNLALIEKYSQKLPLVVLMDGMEARILGPGNHRLDCRPKQTVTLLPVTPQARVSTSGLTYALRNETLERSSRGLSNRVVSRSPRVRVHSGRLWIFYLDPSR